MTEMGLLAENGGVGFTDGVKAVADALVMRRVLAYARTFDQLVIQHPEEPSLAQAGEVSEGEIATKLGLPAITPLAEVIMLERDLRLVEITGARYHAAHVTTAEGIEAIRRAKADGLPVTCDTAPPYFVLNETAIGDYRTFAKLSPPLRSEPDRRAVIGASRTARSTRSPATTRQGPGFQAPAVQLGGVRHHRAGNAVAAVPGALPQPAFAADRGVAAADVDPARILGLEVGRLTRARRPTSSSSTRTREWRSTPTVPLEIEKLAVRRPPGAAAGCGDGRRRPHDLPARRRVTARDPQPPRYARQPLPAERERGSIWSPASKAPRGAPRPVGG